MSKIKCLVIFCCIAVIIAACTSPIEAQKIDLAQAAEYNRPLA